MRRRPPAPLEPTEGPLYRDVHDAYRRHEGALKRFIWRYLRSPPDVEEIAQETFLRAYEVEQRRPIEQPKSFLFRIAKHESLKRLGRKERRVTDFIADLEEGTPTPLESSAEEEISAEQILRLHSEAIEALGERPREAYLLRKMHDLSHKEIAQRLGIAVSTVEKHLIKAMEHCERYVRERLEARPPRARLPRGRARSGT